MDYTFTFKISKDSISINKSKRAVDKKGLNNTNVIDTKELKFSPEYIKENLDLVSTFLNVVILKKGINTCVINTTDDLESLVELTTGWEKIETLVFKEDFTINYGVFIKLLDNNYLKSIECFNIPSYLMERLNMNKHIKITTREKKQYHSRFMIDNLLFSYSDIYYKKTIVITSTFDTKELEDLQNFMAINNRLAVVRFIDFSNEAMAIILNEIKKWNKRNILIKIDEKGNDLDMIYKTIPYLKKNYKKYITDYNITFRINYSLEYKKKNFLKEFNLKLLSTIILIIIAILLIIFGINSYNEYKDANKVEDQMSEINDIIDDFTEIVENPDDVEVIGTSTPRPQSGNTSAYYTNYSRVFEELEKINQDTIGWIKVNNTRIDYPVVQANDNTYYLGRDFKQKKNSMGWIFADYRNDFDVLNSNTIIYGHNIKGGIMFGSIQNMFSNSYLSKEQNNYITFNTKNSNMKWKIFSMYRIPETIDYLKTEFYTKDEYRDFINMIQSRSNFSFDTPVTENDKILTLSTCVNNSTRFVVHAVLVENTSNETPQVQEPITESPTTVTTTTTEYVGN